MKSDKNETVVLVHGLGRTTRCWGRMARTLEAEGYTVRRVGYPSLCKPIHKLADQRLRPVLDELATGNGTFHVVTHSLGGILLRTCLQESVPENLQRVVMLGPPNGGSEIPDRNKWMRTILGPGFSELSTESDSVPNSLGPFPDGPNLLVVAGQTSPWSPWNRGIPKPHDGKVSVASTKLEGMDQFTLVDVGHTTLVSNRKVMELVKEWLAL